MVKGESSENKKGKWRTEWKRAIGKEGKYLVCNYKKQKVKEKIQRQEKETRKKVRN